MKKPILSALLVAALLAVSACGTGEDDTAAKSIADSLMEQQKGDNETLPVKREEADCIGEGMVDGVGVGQLTEYGMLDEDGEVAKNISNVKMSTKDAEATVDSIFDCTDVKKMVRDGMAESMLSQAPEMQRCIEDVLTEDALRSMLVATFSGKEDEATDELMGPLTKCAMGSTDAPE